jgi:PqqD family protein of HPr-rel-A system
VIGASAEFQPQTSQDSSNVRFVATEGIRILMFEDESVVFNPTSWDAHLLNAAAVAVLDELGQAPRSVAEVELLLRESLLETERADASSHAHRLLHEFEELGLAHRLTEDALARG